MADYIDLSEHDVDALEYKFGISIRMEGFAQIEQSVEGDMYYSQVYKYPILKEEFKLFICGEEVHIPKHIKHRIEDSICGQLD